MDELGWVFTKPDITFEQALDLLRFKLRPAEATFSHGVQGLPQSDYDEFEGWMQAAESEWAAQRVASAWWCLIQANYIAGYQAGARSALWVAETKSLSDASRENAAKSQEARRRNTAERITRIVEGVLKAHQETPITSSG